MNARSDRSGPVLVRVPASTSNLGAGFDCVGLALELWLEVRLAPDDGSPAYAGTVTGLEASQDIIAGTLRRELGRLPRIEVTSEIPVARGLGSSAAATVAAYALVQAVTGGPLDRDAVFRAAAAREGHPDNAAPSVFGGLQLAARSPTAVPLHADVGAAFAVPAAPLSTRAARAALPVQVSLADAVAQSARAAALLLGLQRADGELIAFGMDDRLAVPARRALIPGFDQALTAGLAAGAWGVTISGAGSSMLALAPAGCCADVAHAMARALEAAGNPARPLVPGINRTGMTVA